MRNLIALFFCMIVHLACAQEIKLVTEPAEVQRLTDELGKEIKRLIAIANLRSCRPVVHVFVGTMNEIFGAYCSITIDYKPHKILLCNDMIVGLLTISWAHDYMALSPDWEPSADLVVDFVKTNCRP